MNKREQRHIADFFKLKCATQMMTMGLFPNVKEITESVAMFRAVADHLLDDTIRFNNPDVQVVVVGDGHTPRTATLFALRTAWNCHSVDPVLNANTDYSSIRRLSIYINRIEHINLRFGDMATIIVLPHSHAKMEDVLDHVVASLRHVVSMPCCVKHDIPNREYIGFVDEGVWSEKNTVKIWKGV
jgi:hypothetical protein